MTTNGNIEKQIPMVNVEYFLFEKQAFLCCSMSSEVKTAVDCNYYDPIPGSKRIIELLKQLYYFMCFFEGLPMLQRFVQEAFMKPKYVKLLLKYLLFQLNIATLSDCCHKKIITHISVNKKTHD